MDDDSTRTDETPDEREEAERGGETPAEAHRQGEFEELSARLDAISEGIAGLMTAIGALATAPSETPDMDGDVEASDVDAYEAAKLVSLDDLDI